MNLWHHGSISLPVIIQFLLCPIVFLSLIRITAPYGRHFSAGWGPVLPNRLAWLLMELPALVIVGLLLRAARNTWPRCPASMPDVELPLCLLGVCFSCANAPVRQELSRCAGGFAIVQFAQWL
jgi:hypothetical protein